MAEVADAAVPSTITLLDCRPDIDGHLNKIMRAGRQAGLSGPDLADHVYGELGRVLRLKRWLAKVEDWMMTTLPKASTGRPGKQYSPNLSKTKYDGVWSGFMASKASPVIKLAGIDMGIDKVGHFFQLGYDIYEKRNGWNLMGPKFSAKKWNHNKEMRLYGVLATGVYSPADIAANNAGAAFYNAIAKNKAPPTTMSAYVTKQWSEAINPSRYKASIGGTVWNNILVKRDWMVQFTGVSLGANNTFRASFTTNDAGKTYTVTLSVGARSHGVLSLTRTLTTDAEGLVSGLALAGTWAIDGQSGKLSLSSTVEHELIGTWGRGQAATGGGTCQFLA